MRIELLAKTRAPPQLEAVLCDVCYEVMMQKPFGETLWLSARNSECFLLLVPNNLKRNHHSLLLLVPDQISFGAKCGIDARGLLSLAHDMRKRRLSCCNSFLLPSSTCAGGAEQATAREMYSKVNWELEVESHWTLLALSGIHLSQLKITLISRGKQATRDREDAFSFN